MSGVSCAWSGVVCAICAFFMPVLGAQKGALNSALYLIHRTKAFQPILARLPAILAFQKKALFKNKNQGDFSWSFDQKENPSLRLSWRITQNWGRTVLRHCPHVLAVMKRHTVERCSCQIMPYHRVISSCRASSISVVIGWYFVITTR